MAALFIIDEATGAEWRVWPDPEPIAAGTVHELGSYVFELRGGAAAADTDLVIDEVAVEALRPRAANTARWRWVPGFHAGVVEAELRVPLAPPRRIEILTDPDRRKLTRDDFDDMLRDILSDTFALFSLSGFRKGIARGVGVRPPAIARLEFLRTRIEELESIIAAIVRNPRRRLVGDEVALPYYRARRATGPEILLSFRSGRILQQTSRVAPLPSALRGFLPQHIRTRRTFTSLDLPEHRQIGACLRFWLGWLNAAAETIQYAAPEFDFELQRNASIWAARCRRLAQRISLLASAAPFTESADVPARLLLSAVFRNDPAYRRFYRLWQDIDLGIASIFGDFLKLPLARTFELYERWCFLRLVRAGAEEFGREGLNIRDLFVSDAAGGVTIAAGAVTVPVGRGWKLCFQKKYREFWIEPDGRGSYSRMMIPDVVVVHEATDQRPAQLIVLDAKYRIDQGLNDALSSIHAYRDALVHEADSGKVEGIVSAAYLLTPHIPHLHSNYRDTPLPGRLFHPQYRTSFRFGAVTLKPGMSGGDIATALKAIVADATVEGLPS
jgi:hypothetical protein